MGIIDEYKLRIILHHKAFIGNDNVRLHVKHFQNAYPEAYPLEVMQSSDMPSKLIKLSGR